MKFEPFKLVPVGYVRKDGETFIEILPEFSGALHGLNEGDWIKLILWFHASDRPERRSVLKVHPYNNPENPLRGVFATRSPVRPNPLAIYAVRINRIEGNRLYIDWIDAMDGTPVVDIKILVERLDCPRETLIPEQELNIPASRQVGEVNLIPRKSKHLNGVLVLELGPRMAVLTAKELAELIAALKGIYENLPAEIRKKFRKHEEQMS
ncbi:tRNA (N6-threonylcarbamoyladenosine(37)-N6)-methyltransferase TrmO [Thermococcus sp.]